MVLTKLENKELIKNAHNVDVRNLCNTKDAMVSVFTRKPDEQLKRYITPVNIAFCVLAGTGVVEIGLKKQTVEKNSPLLV